MASSLLRSTGLKLTSQRIQYEEIWGVSQSPPVPHMRSDVSGVGQAPTAAVDKHKTLHCHCFHSALSVIMTAINVIDSPSLLPNSEDAKHELFRDKEEISSPTPPPLVVAFLAGVFLRANVEEMRRLTQLRHAACSVQSTRRNGADLCSLDTPPAPDLLTYNQRTASSRLPLSFAFIRGSDHKSRRPTYPLSLSITVQPATPKQRSIC